MRVRRENWKGKYFIVARDTNGRILSRKKGGTGKVVLVEQFKKTSTFNAKVSRRKLKKVYEIRDERKTPYIGSIGANYYISVTLSDGRKISVMSRRLYSRREIPDAKEEAERDLLGKVSMVVGNSDVYDEELGERILNKVRITERREGVVRYANA